MSFAEIVGYAAMYVIAFVVAGYALIAVLASAFGDRGLAAIPIIFFPTIALWIIGATVGLVLLGMTLA